MNRLTSASMESLFDPGYFTERELQRAGFRSIGKNVRIAKNCTIIGLANVEIGSNVRIDGYSTITAAGSGYLRIGSYVHVGGYCLLSAGDGIILEDFSGLSQSVRIYSRTSDYSGNFLTNPTVPEKFAAVVRGEVRLRRHVIVGSGTTILPGVVVGEGTSIGAMSLVTKPLDEWSVYFGSPAKRLKARSKQLLELERQLLAEVALNGG